MTSGEQPVYEYRVVLGAATWVGVEADYARWLVATTLRNATVERRQVGPWEKVEQ